LNKIQAAITVVLGVLHQCHPLMANEKCSLLHVNLRQLLIQVDCARATRLVGRLDIGR
jgi:hypothetical protein